MALIPNDSWSGDWIPSTVAGYDFMSNMHTDNGSTSFTTTVTVPDDGVGRQFSYSWSVSSESGYDFMRLFIDGTEVWNKSGVQNGSNNFDLSPGSHTLEFRYTKDGSASAGADTGYFGNAEIKEPNKGTALVSEYQRVYTVTQAVPKGWASLDKEYYRFRQIDGNYENTSQGITGKYINGFLTGSTVFNDNPLPFCKVNLYDRRTGILVRSTRSDVGGKFRFLDLVPKQGIYYCLAVDPDNIPIYNSIVYDHIAPVPYDISLSGEFVLDNTQGTMDQGINIDSGMAPFSVSVISGSLPGGITLGISDDNRQVVASGTSTFYQDYYFTIKVQNGQGYVAQKDVIALLPYSFGKSSANEGSYFQLVFSSVSDPYFMYVRSMMNMDNLIDTVSANRVWTLNGGSFITDSQSKFGKSLYVPTNDSVPGGLSTPYDARLDISTVNDWTIECDIFLPQAITGNESRTIFTQNYANNNLIAFGIGNSIDTNQNLNAAYIGYFNSGWSALFSNIPVPIGRWVHIAATKKDQIFSLFFDGMLVGRGLKGQPALLPTSQPFYIGRRWDQSAAGVNFGGYIDDFRITKGVARYTKNFTTSISAWPTQSPDGLDELWDSVRSALTFENNFNDDGPLGYIWTAENNAVISDDTTLAYSGSKSLSLPGDKISSIYISSDRVPMQNPADPFCVDLWFNHTGEVLNDPYGDALFSQCYQGSGGEQAVLLNPNKSVTFLRNNHFTDTLTAQSVAGVWSPGVYNHYALTFDGVYMRQFINGVKVSETSTLYGWFKDAAGENFRIGRCTVNQYPQYDRGFNGYIDNFRITLGTPRWVDNFVPPVVLNTKTSEDPQYHVREFNYQPIGSGGTWNNISVRRSTATLTYDSTKDYMLFSNPSSDNTFISFDDWGDFSGNYFFEIETEFVSDFANRNHWGLFLAHGDTGYYGYRLSNLDSGVVTSIWNNSSEYNNSGTYYPAAVPFSVGNRYTWRFEVINGVMQVFVNNIFAMQLTNSDYVGLRPGIHGYGVAIGIRKITTGTLTTPADQEVVTPQTGYNVAYGKRAWLKNVSDYYIQSGANPSGYWEAVDNSFNQNYYISGQPGSSLIVDLEQPTKINQVKVFHYYSGDNRTYLSNKTEISPDGINWTTVYDANVDGSYAESSTGHIINFGLTPVRFIKDTASGNTVNNINHWQEVQAFLQ